MGLVRQITLSQLLSCLCLLHVVVSEEELVVWFPLLLNNLVIVQLLEQLVELGVPSSDPDVIWVASSVRFIKLSNS